jgi:hypothetical protein
MYIVVVIWPYLYIHIDPDTRKYVRLVTSRRVL